MTVARIFTKNIYLYIFILGFLRKPEKLGSHTGSKWWPGEPDVKDDPNDRVTRWPNDPVPCLLLCVPVCAGHTGEPCRNSWNDCDAVSGREADSRGPEEPVFIWWSTFPTVFWGDMRRPIMKCLDYAKVCWRRRRCGLLPPLLYPLVVSFRFSGPYLYVVVLAVGKTVFSWTFYISSQWSPLWTL